ncbi:MAG: hypothetical protein KVP17_000714 [Porospora cf. gigantea B]|uniref:uncharacterized protein n=1 Tax=Porospora cf. gigantea B TaxID=2853592 RepID=UPI003571AC81|nr:MAG: hypothetical protein KVP17_000714 [Porospora cf. gigantea B]
MDLLPHQHAVTHGAHAKRHVESSLDACLGVPENPSAEPVSTGTTILALRCVDGVVLAADTRTSAGGYIVNRASRKISPVHDRIFVCRSGSAADTQYLTTMVKMYIAQHAQELGKAPTVKSVASIFRLLCYQNKDQLTAGLIVAGYDDEAGYQVYSIPVGGAIFEAPYAIGGSGSIFISGLTEVSYNESMTVAEAHLLAQQLVSRAISNDGSSGGMVRSIIVQKDGLKESVLLGNEVPL